MTHRYDLVPREPQQRKVPPRQPNFSRGFLSGALLFLVLGVFVLGVLIIGYAVIAGGLPAPSDLADRASDFQTTRIYDRAGNLLNETFDPNAGRRTVAPLERMAPALIQATIATEDANFYAHAGVDPVALVRALYYAVQEGDVVSGGSTIPQQLVKMVFLSPERSIRRKINEAILSSEISRRYSKQEILEIYLNELYYGNLAYGVEAAAETYFGKDVGTLTLGEAALLAGLPQLPAFYDPYTHPDRAKERQKVVLGLMVEQDAITAAEADAAWLEPLSYQPPEFSLEAPHFTLYVRQQLESIFENPDDIYRTGLEVYTTLDPTLQNAAEQIVSEQVAAIAEHNASNGALVALRPQSGEILALVGSADFENVEIDGQVNMALAPRQPGSSIKPFVYLSAFEMPDRPISQRWTPGTLIADIKTAFPDGANPPYIPTNYDDREHGMVTARTALGSSYNIPAVRALQEAGLPALLELMQRLGVSTLTRPDYGLSLALGGGEIPLLELTGAYGILANAGLRVPPTGILEIRDSAGNTLCQLGSDRPCMPDVAIEAVNPIDAYLITDVLSDNDARTPAFGPNSLLNLDRPAAVKTGTTNDFRDNLTIGYTPQLVTGVWVGNADNSPMRDISGVTGAGPIWHQFMTFALAEELPLAFAPPPGVRLYDVCTDTGTSPNVACPARQQRIFAEDRPPLPPTFDLWQRIRIDRNSGQLASDLTPGDAVEERDYKVYPAQYRQWAEEYGIPQPPPEYVHPGHNLIIANGAEPESNAGDTVVASPTAENAGRTDPAPQFSPRVTIREPFEGQVVDGAVSVIGSAFVPDFTSYELTYGVSHNPGAFSLPIAQGSAPVDNDLLGQFDTRRLSNGPHTLRLLVRDRAGSQFEARIRLFVEHVPTATPIPPTPTWTPLPTSTPVPTIVPPAASATPVPIDTIAPPTATWTPVPTAGPTETPTTAPDEPTSQPGVSAPPPPVDPENDGAIDESDVVTASTAITSSVEISSTTVNTP